MNRNVILASLVLLCCAFPVYPGQPRLESKHRQLTLAGRAGESFQLLENENPLVFTATGPGEVAFRFCLILSGDKLMPLVDITVVRDENVQGTVRARMETTQSHEFTSGERCSATQLLFLAVPTGKHRYQIFFTGVAAVAISPAQAIRAGEKTIEATPAQDRKAVTTLPAREKAKKSTASRRLENPGEEVLDSPQVGTFSLPWHMEIMRSESVSRVAFDTSVAFTALLTTASVACLISAGVIQYQARQEEIQTEAGRLHERARRTWKAAAAVSALAALSAISAFSFYVQLSRDGVETRLQVRF